MNSEHNTELLGAYLKGRHFTSFCFDNFFELNFYADAPLGSQLREIRLTIMSNWWFDDKEGWQKKVLNYGRGVEPIEPVTAYELALLRWSSGATVTHVSLHGNFIRIEFMNNKTINISLVLESEDDEYAYILLDNNDIILSYP